MASTTRGDADDGKAIVVDPFCFRRTLCIRALHRDIWEILVSFDGLTILVSFVFFFKLEFAENKEAAAAYGGTVFSQSLADFEATVNERYGGDESLLQEGYAPFCKHLFLENDFTGSDAVLNVLKITDSNQHLIVSEYSARNEKELPVLTRYFPKESVLKEEGHLPVAKYLDLILYSRDQINKESAAMGSTKPEETAPWGIVSIKAQDVNHELPMTPITAMRNALGKDEGGSGIPLDRESYLEAVAYWKDHATVS